MRSSAIGVLGVLVAGLGLASPAFAQKGVGDTSGVARQATQPQVVSLTGKIVEVKTGPCESATGRSPVGTHLLLQTPKGERLNIHLGPAEAVAEMVAKLSIGEQATVQAFRTEKMKEQHYVAKSLKQGDVAVELRDENLRPFWAQGPGRGGQGRGWGMGYGFGGRYRHGGGWGR